MSLRSLVAACFFSLLFVFNASADTVEQKYEYARRIQAAQAIGPLGTSLFGDETNYNNGSTTFTQVDVSVPGNSGLPVQVARTWSTAAPEGPTAPGLFGEWELDMPVMHGVFARNYGWQVRTATPNNRCSVSGASYVEPGAASNKTGTFGGADYWRGNFLYVPGAGDQQLLFRAPGYTKQPTDGQTYNWVTTSHWQVRCLPAPLPSGQPGEGFLAVSPDGTKYTFNWMVGRPYSTLQRTKALAGGGTQVHQLNRDEVRIYPTRVEDRFGNWVTYTYSGEKVTEIRANDGRLITLTYNAQNAIETVTSASQVWRYEYTTSRRLSRVVLPDTSAWTFNSPTLILTYAPEQANSGCASMGTWNVGAQSFTMTHPSGASGVFTFAPTRHGRSTQLLACHIVDGEMEYGPPKLFDNYGLTTKVLSGPGVASTQWTIGYPVACVQCATKTVTVTQPDQSVTRHTFGTRYYIDEGKLLRTETLTQGGALVRDESSAYATEPASPPYAYQPGYTGMSQEDAFGSTRVVPQTATTIAQDGAMFSSQTNSFDSFARPLSVAKSSGGMAENYSKTDGTEYHDHLGKWVLGQVSRSTTNGIETSRTVFDATTALPLQSYSFGKLQQTLTYNAEGTVATVKDGNNNVTTLTNWYRGIPRNIQYADSTTKSAVVNDNGWVTAVTDENGFATGYGYDAMGRIASIVYPTDDSTAWNTTTRVFEWANFEEYGLPPGHWREHIRTGNHRKYIFYDALWRPVAEQEDDFTQQETTLRWSAKRYDTNGRLVFASYPRNPFQQGWTTFSNTDLTGVRTEYDALDRVTSVKQDSELGQLTTTTEYLPGFQTRVTNPRNQQTTNGYQVYDAPSYDLLRWSVQPEGKVTEIFRHPQLGNPEQVRQRNSDGTLQQSRYYVYDGYRQLCKTSEPETGATLIGYDGAGNVAWSAAGLPGATACDASGNTSEILARKATRAYDVRNRLTQLTFPDGRGNQAWTYKPDGLPASITTYNDAGNGAPVVNAYDYNKRRMLTGESVAQTGWYAWGIGYGYDANGALLNNTYPTGLVVNYSPNALGQATAVTSTDDWTYASGVSYYPNGAIKQFTFGNGIVHTMVQNARQLPQRSTDSGGVLDHEYVYDPNANVQYIYDHRNPADHRYLYYDGLDRLTSAGSQMFGGDHWHRFTYDALDNLKSWKLPGIKDYAEYVYDAKNQLTNIKNSAGASVVGLGYDVQGNLANKNGVTYQFDFGNRLRETTGKEWYRYDGLGRRVLNWRWSEAGVLSQYSQSGQLMYDENYRAADRKATEYVYLAGSLITTRARNVDTGAWTVSFHHTDALGSPVAKTNPSAQVIDRTNWEPYGAAINKPNYDGIGYTGHVMDSATGLTYMQQRYYDPGVGRFLSVDPVTADGNTGGNFNRYKYAANNPYRYVDPDGREERDRRSIGSKSPSFANSEAGTMIDRAPAGSRAAARQSSSGTSRGRGGTGDQPSGHTLSIRSNAGSDSGLADGHAWLSEQAPNGVETTWGLWPDSHPAVKDNGDGTDVRKNMELGQKVVSNKSYKLSNIEYRKFQKFLITTDEWGYTHTCADWARDGIKAATGADVDVDDYFGIETPRELSETLGK